MFISPSEDASNFLVAVEIEGHMVSFGVDSMDRRSPHPSGMIESIVIFASTPVFSHVFLPTHQLGWATIAGDSVFPECPV